MPGEGGDLVTSQVEQGRGGGGQAQVRERKCYTVESAESRSDREEVSDNCA